MGFGANRKSLNTQLKVTEKQVVQFRRIPVKKYFKRLTVSLNSSAFKTEDTYFHKIYETSTLFSDNVCFKRLIIFSKNISECQETHTHTHKTLVFLLK